MITILSFIMVIGVVIFIHELGHFLAAKSIGVRVEKFYLGFNFFGLGWEKEYKGTIYGIGLFPLGGYVKVACVIDESMDTEFSGASDEFRSKNMLQKMRNGNKNQKTLETPSRQPGNVVENIYKIVFINA